MKVESIYEGEGCCWILPVIDTLEKRALICVSCQTVFNGTRVACRQNVNNEILRASRCGVRERGGERLCEYNSDFRGHKFVKYDFVRSKYFRKCDDRHTLSGHLLTFV